MPRAKFRYSAITSFSTALTSGVLLPLGLPPFNFWILSFAGAALFFSRTQLLAREVFCISVPGFTLGYVLTGQLWTFLKLNPEYIFQKGEFVHFTFLLFVLPAVLQLAVMGLYPFIKKLFIFPPFSTGSALLFSILWLTFEVLYSLLSTKVPPYLLSGYSIIGLPSDSLVPLFGIFGASLFLALSSSLCSSLIYQFQKKHPRHRVSLGIALTATLIAPWLCSSIDWTSPYDKRPFNYIMQTQPDSQKITSIIESTSPPHPKLMILGTTFKAGENQTWPAEIKNLDTIRDTAFVAPFATSLPECTVFYCVFGEGDGCTCRSRHNKQPVNVYDANLPISDPSTVRPPAVDAYRIMILESPDDLNPFLIPSRIIGAEAVIVYDTPVLTKDTQERLLRIDRARALEVSRPLLRYSSTGLSAQINSDGVTEASYLPEGEFITGQITPMTGITPYMHFGYLSPLAFIALTMVVFVYRRLFLSL